MSLSETRRIERRLSEPIDAEREIWDYSKYRYVRDGGRVFRVPRVDGGTSFSGTMVEQLYANSTAGNALATFTAEATMYAATQSQAVLPANFWDPSYGSGRTLRVTCRGIYSTTSAPTFTAGFRIGTAQGIAGAIVGTTLAVTAQTTVTNLAWELEFDITWSSFTVASSHNEVLVNTFGMLGGVSTGNNGFTNGSAIGTQTPTTAATITQADSANYLTPTITCGTSNASNKWQMLQMVVLGMG